MNYPQYAALVHRPPFTCLLEVSPPAGERTCEDDPRRAQRSNATRLQKKASSRSVDAAAGEQAVTRAARG
jgi:hypothetical protein